MAETVLDMLLCNKDSFVSRYAKRRHWWFIVELPLTPNSVYDDILPSPVSPHETNLTNKFLDSLSTYTSSHVTRTYNLRNYIFGYIHYPNKNVSKWKAAYDLKIFPRCMVPETRTHLFKTLLRDRKMALSQSARNSLEASLATATYKALQHSLGLNHPTFNPVVTQKALNDPKLLTLKNQVENSEAITIPSQSHPKHPPPHNSNRVQKWEIYLNTKYPIHQSTA